jgi:hypothetical protein
VAGKAEDPAPAAGNELGGGEQANPELLGFPAASVTLQGEHRHPGEEVEGEGDDLHPDLVLGDVV